MNQQSFDLLARSTTTGVSRRSLVTLGGAGLMAALASPFMAEAKKKNKKRKKRRQPSGIAPVNAPVPPSVTCPAGTFALGGRCAPVCAQVCLDRGGVCLDTLEGFLVCAPNITSCASVPKLCGSNADCGAQEFCTPSLCGPNQSVENRCAPFLN